MELTVDLVVQAVDQETPLELKVLLKVSQLPLRPRVGVYGYLGHPVVNFVVMVPEEGIKFATAKSRTER